MKLFIGFLFLLVTPLLTGIALGADAPAMPATLPADPVDLLGFILAAFTSHDWNLVASGVLTVIVYLLMKTPLHDKIPAKAWPWVAAACGLAGSVATNLAAHVLWYKAIIQGLIVGASAVGLWEMLFKHILPATPAPAAAPAPQDPPKAA